MFKPLFTSKCLSGSTHLNWWENFCVSRHIHLLLKSHKTTLRPFFTHLSAHMWIQYLKDLHTAHQVQWASCQKQPSTPHSFLSLLGLKWLMGSLAFKFYAATETFSVLTWANRGWNIENAWVCAHMHPSVCASLVPVVHSHQTLWGMARWEQNIC